MIDEIDLKIVALLQEDGRLSNAAIAETVGLTASSVFERVKKLEKRGTIQKYVAIVDPAALGRPITAFVRLVLGGATADYAASKSEIAALCLADAAVLECHTVAGDDCYILKVRVASPSALEMLQERLRRSGLVSRSTTNIVLTTVKETTKVG